MYNIRSTMNFSTVQVILSYGPIYYLKHGYSCTTTVKYWKDGIHDRSVLGFLSPDRYDTRIWLAGVSVFSSFDWLFQLLREKLDHA